jgi:hypothetical protein
MVPIESCSFIARAEFLAMVPPRAPYSRSTVMVRITAWPPRFILRQ